MDCPEAAPQGCASSIDCAPRKYPITTPVSYPRTPMPIHLSRNQAKQADRVGGIELLIPWPRDLPDPGLLDDDSERDATPAERAWVESHVQPACQSAGLVAVRSFVARLRGPHPDGPPARQHTRLGVVIIGQRWVRATGAPDPRTMWYQP